MRKIALISSGHAEAALCLTKHLALQGMHVDYYRLVGNNDTGVAPAIEYSCPNKHFIFSHKLQKDEAPELYEYFKGGDASVYLFKARLSFKRISIVHFVVQLLLRILFKIRGYDVINIIGQSDNLIDIHRTFRNYKTVHSLHEVGSHQDGVLSTDLINYLIENKIPLHFFSESTKNRFLQIPNSDSCVVDVIPFGKFETYLLYERKIKFDVKLDFMKPTFLFFGFITPYKGLDLLKRALMKLIDYQDNYNIIIAGAGNDNSLPFFQNQRNCFVLNRHITNQEIIYLNRIANIVVMPYKTASQTGIVPTVFLFDTPVIATNVGALPEVVVDGENGILVNPCADEIANAMLKCINEPAIIKKLSEGTKKFGKGDIYDWNIIAQKTIDLFYNISK